MNYVTTTINNLNNHGLANKTHKIIKSAEKRKELSYTGKKKEKLAHDLPKKSNASLIQSSTPLS